MVSVKGETSSTASQLLQAQSQLWNYVFQYIGPMSLKCAVELGIPDAIHRHGRRISLSELSAALSFPPEKSPQLCRLMRLLTHSGIFSSESNAQDGDLYLLTPVSRLLVKGTGGGLSPFVLAMLDPIIMTPFQFMGAWFTGDSPTPFAEANEGDGFWDVTFRNHGFNATFNNGMASDAVFISEILVKENGDVFKGLRSIVDVGGGTGSAARAIADAFPTVKCSVMDLAQVVGGVRDMGNVEFIVGDMFECVPNADAVLLKWILHDWDDKHCVKILKRCKDAIPSKEEGGKVIIIDFVVGSKDSDPKSRETQLHFDVMMFVLCGAIEREEHQWRKIFFDAGFTDYKIMPVLGLRSLIEVYP